MEISRQFYLVCFRNALKVNDYFLAMRIRGQTRKHILIDTFTYKHKHIFTK
jgi:hypothetical protein